MQKQQGKDVIFWHTYFSFYNSTFLLATCHLQLGEFSLSHALLVTVQFQRLKLEHYAQTHEDFTFRNLQQHDILLFIC